MAGLSPFHFDVRPQHLRYWAKDGVHTTPMATYLLLGGGIAIAVLLAFGSIFQSWREEKRRDIADRANEK